MKKVLLLFLLLWILEGCSPARTDISHAEGQMAPIQVSLRLFSGREPPTWMLSENDAKAFVDMIKSLPVANQAVPEPRMGYGGFNVALPESPSSKPTQLRVYNGVVTSTSTGTTTLLSDPGRRVEQLLLRSAQAHVPANVYTVMIQQAKLPQ